MKVLLIRLLTRHANGSHHPGAIGDEQQEQIELSSAQVGALIRQVRLVQGLVEEVVEHVGGIGVQELLFSKHRSVQKQRLFFELYRTA